MYTEQFLIIWLWLLLSAAFRSLYLKSCFLLGIIGCYLRDDSLSLWIGYQRVFYGVKSFYSGVMDYKAKKSHSRSPKITSEQFM